ncbi:MAG: DUF998 domain-containing protein [Phormidesmis sp.]
MPKTYLGLPTSKLLLICGVVGIFGCASVLLTNAIGTVVVDGYNPISQTISDLAIAEKAWIQDTGLDLFAVSFITCAIGLLALNLGGLRWRAGAFTMLLLAVDIALIAEHNKYANREGVGTAIHIYCVYALGALFTAAPLLMAAGLRKISHGWYLYSLGTAASWAVLSPLFFFTPTSWDGAYERFISLIMITWVALISWLLIQKAKDQRKQLASTRSNKQQRDNA